MNKKCLLSLMFLFSTCFAAEKPIGTKAYSSSGSLPIAMHAQEEQDNHDFVQLLIEKKEDEALEMLESHTINVNYLATLNNIIYNFEDDEKSKFEQTMLQSMLYIAIERKLQKIALQLIKNGADVNKGYQYNEMEQQVTPLYKACQYGLIDCVIALIEANVNLNDFSTFKNKEQQTALDIALHSNQPQIALKLIKSGANVNNGYIYDDGTKQITPLYRASQLGFIDCVTALLEKGVDINTFSTFDNGNQQTALGKALFDKNYEIALKLIKTEGIDPNKGWISANKEKQVTPLYRACKNGYTDFVKILLAKKANPNTFSIFDNDTQQTALYIALVEKHNDIALELIKTDDIDINKGWTAADRVKKITPLYRASQLGFIDCVTALLKKGADVNAISTFSDGTIKQTALYRALRDNHLDIALQLITYGADTIKVSQSYTNNKRTHYSIFIDITNKKIETLQKTINADTLTNETMEIEDAQNTLEERAGLTLKIAKNRTLLSNTLEYQSKILDLIQKKIRENPLTFCAFCYKCLKNQDFIVSPCCSALLDSSCMLEIMQNKIEKCPFCKEKLFSTLRTPILRYEEEDQQP